MQSLLVGIVIFVLLAYVFKRLLSKQPNDEEIRNSIVAGRDVPRPLFQGGQCSICLEQKKYEVSATCGHSYCGKCITDIYQKQNDRILCPLCRQPITTMIKCYHNIPADEIVKKISYIVKDYNKKYCDDRSSMRAIGESPYLLKRMIGYICSVQFILYFITSKVFFISILLISLYFWSPIDLIPEMLFGAIGYVDDIFIGIIILIVGITIFSVSYIRIQQ